MSERKTPFTIHSLDPSGVNIVTRSVSPFTADSVVLLPGDSYEITSEIYELSRDRDGNSWLDRDSTHWGHGEVPQHVKDAAESARLETLRAERDNLLHMNPHLARATAASLRLDALNAALEG